MAMKSIFEYGTVVLDVLVNHVSVYTGNVEPNNTYTFPVTFNGHAGTPVSDTWMVTIDAVDPDFPDGGVHVGLSDGSGFYYFNFAAGTVIQLRLTPVDTESIQAANPYIWDFNTSYGSFNFNGYPSYTSKGIKLELQGDIDTTNIGFDGSSVVPDPETIWNSGVEVPDITNIALTLWTDIALDGSGIGARGYWIGFNPQIDATVAPPPGSCFWTDFIGCMEECDDTPIPPVDPGVFNARTWNMDYQTGCCSGADKSCVQTDGLVDSFGDVPKMPEPLNAPSGSSLSPTMGTLSLIIPMRALSRGTPPSCTDTLPTPMMRATANLTPYPGGAEALDWDLIGAFNTVPYINMTYAVYNSPDGSGSPVLTGTRAGDLLIQSGVTPWTLSALLDLNLSDPAMPNTENASVVVSYAYTGAMTSGTPVVMESIVLNVEATCPC